MKKKKKKIGETNAKSNTCKKAVWEICVSNVGWDLEIILVGEECEEGNLGLANSTC